MFQVANMLSVAGADHIITMVNLVKKALKNYNSARFIVGFACFTNTRIF